ncbi:MAG: threonylcarbamoyl-AMP synthase [SAR202 cluster bacterium]|nr:threonylcarbamoyl-AMP synthase [SAR202 cluster bacterium]
MALAARVVARSETLVIYWREPVPPHNEAIAMPCVPDSDSNRALAAQLLQRGDVVAYPTDTLYGLGASIFNEAAVRKVFAVKQRDATQGLPILVASVAQLGLVAVDIPPEALRLAEQFWPGSLTLVLRRNPAVPLIVSGGDTVAVRVPAHPTPRALVNGGRAPITGTSANLHGGPQPTTAQEVERQLGNSIPLILDGGPCVQKVPSTILDVTTMPARVVRLGAIGVDQLRMVCDVAGSARGGT